jgi:hypothetical protein
MTGVSYDVAMDVGTDGIAGGLFVGPGFLPGKIVIGGMIQNSDPPGIADWIFVYELREDSGGPAQEFLVPGFYNVTASVENYGTYTEDFDVNAKVYLEGDGKDDVLYYEDNVSVVGLAAGSLALCNFADIEFLEGAEWEGNYRFEITTMLVGDEVAGNDQKTKTLLMHAPDDIPPVTTHEFTGTMGEDDWYVSDVTITLTAEDPVEKGGKWASGVNNTYISIDGAAFELYTEPVIIADDGEHTLEYYSDDMVGNTELINGPFDFDIDQTVPTISLSWSNETKTLTADVDDETSGVAKVEFYVNDEFVGEVTSAPWELEYPDAAKGDTAQAIVYDNAGNSAVSASINPLAHPQGQSQPTVVVKQIQPKNIV